MLNLHTAYPSKVLFSGSAVLPGVSSRDILSWAQHRGYSVEYGGKHPKIIIPGSKRPVPIPAHGHKDISLHVIQSLAEATDMRLNELKQLLKAWA